MYSQRRWYILERQSSNRERIDYTIHTSTTSRAKKSAASGFRAVPAPGGSRLPLLPLSDSPSDSLPTSPSHFARRATSTTGVWADQPPQGLPSRSPQPTSTSEYMDMIAVFEAMVGAGDGEDGAAKLDANLANGLTANRRDHLVVVAQGRLEPG